ncbi:MAG: hypothetical protein ACRDK7_12125 [Solirubrobacteraceae bacterium]
MTARTWFGRGVRRLGLGLIMAASLGAALGVLVGGPAFAAGETGGSPTEPGTSPTGTSNCPSSNPPNELTLVAGTPQTTTLNSAFTGGLQVALSNSDGCAVTGAAGVPVTFTAPSAGASGLFSASNSNTVTVGADSSGSAAAPTFTANDTQGSYTVTASSQYGSVSFALTNAAVAVGVWCSTLDKRASLSAGEPVKLTPGVGSTQSAPAGARFPIRLAVTVTDAEGNPVPNAQIAFSAPAHGASGRFTTHTRGSHHHHSHASHSRTVRVKTNACGIAVAPPFAADDRRGGYVVKASVKHAGTAAFALVNEAP